MAHPMAYPMAHPKFCSFFKKNNQKKSQTRVKSYKVKQTNTLTKKQIYRKIRKEPSTSFPRNSATSQYPGKKNLGTRQKNYPVVPQHKAAGYSYSVPLTVRSLRTVSPQSLTCFLKFGAKYVYFCLLRRQKRTKQAEVSHYFYTKMRFL